MKMATSLIIALLFLLSIQSVWSCTSSKQFYADLSPKNLHNAIHTFPVETRGGITVDGSLPYGFHYGSSSGEVSFTTILSQNEYVLRFKCAGTPFTLTVKRLGVTTTTSTSRFETTTISPTEPPVTTTTSTSKDETTPFSPTLNTSNTTVSTPSISAITNRSITHSTTISNPNVTQSSTGTFVKTTPTSRVRTSPSTSRKKTSTSMRTSFPTTTPPVATSPTPGIKTEVVAAIVASIIISIMIIIGIGILFYYVKYRKQVVERKHSTSSQRPLSNPYEFDSRVIEQPYDDEGYDTLEPNRRNIPLPPLPPTQTTDDEYVGHNPAEDDDGYLRPISNQSTSSIVRVIVPDPDPHYVIEEPEYLQMQ